MSNATKYDDVIIITEYGYYLQILIGNFVIIQPCLQDHKYKMEIMVSENVLVNGIPNKPEHDCYMTHNNMSNIVKYHLGALELNDKSCALKGLQSTNLRMRHILTF